MDEFGSLYPVYFVVKPCSLLHSTFCPLPCFFRVEKNHFRHQLWYLTLLSLKTWGFLLQRELQNTPKTNQYSNIPDYFTLSKHTPTARRRWREIYEALATTPTFVQDLGFILPGFRIGNCPLDLLRFLCVRLTANHNIIIKSRPRRILLANQGYHPSHNDFSPSHQM